VKETGDGAMILQVYRKYHEYMVEKNTLALSVLLDDAFELVHMTGYAQTKNEWLDQIDAEAMRYYSSAEKDVTVSGRNDTATITGRNLVDARINGYRNTWRLQLEMEFLKRNGIWTIIYATASAY
jgi:hypothetical protein